MNKEFKKNMYELLYRKKTKMINILLDQKDFFIVFIWLMAMTMIHSCVRLG